MPTPFVGEWGWENNGPWQDFSIGIAAKGDSLLFVAGGVFLGGARIQMPEIGGDGNYLPQAHLLVPTRGNTATDVPRRIAIPVLPGTLSTYHLNCCQLYCVGIIFLF